MNTSTSDDYADLPQQMRDAKRWLVWNFEDQGEGKKPRKVPYYVSGARRHGTQNTPADAGAFGTFDQAIKALSTTKYIGLGFALGGPDEHGKYWQGVDLDKVPERPWLHHIPDELGAMTYTEKSPSGTGWHAIGYGKPFENLASNPSGIECYGMSQFFTVTCDSPGLHEPVDLADYVGTVLRPLHDEYGRKKPTGSTTGASEHVPPGHANGPINEWIFSEQVERLGRKLRTGDGRYALLLQYVGSLSGRKLSKTQVSILVSAAVAQCFDPSDPPQSKHLTDIIDGLFKKDDAKNPADAPIQWADPLAIKADLPEAPEFDAGALLPKTLADFVMDEADRMPCSPDYVATALLVALGSVIGAKVALKPKRRGDWIVTPNLYGGIVGLPSEKKTPAINSAMRFLNILANMETERQVERENAYEAELAAFEAQQAAVKTSMKKAASGNKPDSLKMAAAIEDFQGLQKPEKPKPRRFRTDDASVEKLGDLLVYNPYGILVFRDELTGLLSSWERDGHEQDRAFYLEGWNGTGSFNIDRIGRGELYVKNVCLSVFGGIQPDLLERYLSGIITGMDNDGRFQRFQVLVYPNSVNWRWVDRYPVQGAREAVRDLFYRLASFDPLQDGAAPANDFVKLPHVCFNDDAQELFIEWSTELHHKLMASETNPMIVQLLGKYEKLFCSIALILHFVEVGIGDVGVDSALRAAAWCEYLLGHARRVYGMVDALKINTANALSNHLAKGKLADGFTARDVRRKGWANISTTDEAERELAILEDHNHVMSYDDHQDKTGRPTTRYRINPKIRGAT